MSRVGLRRLGGLFGPAALLVLACAPARIVDDGGAGADTTGADGGGASSSGSSSSGGTDTGSSGGGTGTGSPGDDGTPGTGTEVPPTPCGVVPLADIAAGIGGFAMDGEDGGDRSGHSVSGAGDVNGDGLADVIVAAPAAGEFGDWGGRAYVVFGKATGSTVSLADVAGGTGGFAIGLDQQGEYPPESVSAAGDVNGDGLADVIVGAGAASATGEYSGRAYVVFGKADTSTVWVPELVAGIGGFAIDGEAERSYVGFSVSGAGDVNGDGLDDVMVGAPWARLSDTTAGRTYVVFGKAQTPPVALADVAQGIGGFAIDGENEYDNAGTSVSGVGDMNGDGLADMVVGAPSAGPARVGRAYVVFGKESTDLVALADVVAGTGGFVMDGEAEGDYCGASVSGAGDVNGDGIPDVVVGALAADPNGYDSGRSYVVFGKANTNGVSLAHVAQGTGGFAIDGEAEQDWSGWSVSAAGDLNGDGLADVILGAPYATPTGSLSGRSYVVFGKAEADAVQLADVAQGIGGFALDGEPAEGRSGFSVSGAVDVNRDGLADVVVGAPLFSLNGTMESGRSYVIFGGDFSCEG